MGNNWLNNIESVIVAAETAFGAGNTTDAQYQNIRPDAEGFTVEGGIAPIDRNVIKGNTYQYSPTPGANSAKFAFKLPCRSGGTAAGTAAGEAPKELAIPLAACLGTGRSSLGVNLPAQAGTAKNYASVASGPAYNAGDLIWIAPTDGATREARWLSRIATNDLYWDDWRNMKANIWDVAANVATNGDLFGCYNYYPTGSNGAMLHSNSMVAQIASHAVDSLVRQRTLKGLKGKVSLADIKANNRIMASFDFMGISLEQTSAAAPTEDPTLGVAYPFSPVELIANAGEFRLNGQVVCAFDLSIALDFDLTPKMCVGATWGVADFVAVPAGGEVKWKMYARDTVDTGSTIDLEQYLNTLADTCTPLDFSWVTGSSANGMGFHAPAVCIARPKVIDATGIRALEITGKIVDPELLGIANVAAAQSWVLAFCGKN